MTIAPKVCSFNAIQTYDANRALHLAKKAASALGHLGPAVFDQEGDSGAGSHEPEEGGAGADGAGQHLSFLAAGDGHGGCEGLGVGGQLGDGEDGEDAVFGGLAGLLVDEVVAGLAGDDEGMVVDGGDGEGLIAQEDAAEGLAETSHHG